MTTEIKWVAPTVPDAILTMTGPPFKPAWFAPGVAGNVLQIDDLGRLSWKPIPPAPPAPTVLDWPLLAPDGTAAAPSYSFVSAPNVGLSAFDYVDGAVTQKKLRFTVRPARGFEAFEMFAYGANITDGQGCELDILSEDGNSWAYFGLWEATGGNEVYIGGTPDLALWAGSSVWRLLTTGEFQPEPDNTYDLGDPTHQIRDLYLAGQIIIDGVPLAPGAQGPPGPQGPQGATGPAGPGVPVGGAAGQILSKLSATDYATGWIDAPSGGGGMTNPMTAVGDLIRGGASGAPTRLAVGTNGNWLTLSAGVPTWAALPVDPGFPNPLTALGDLFVGGASGAPSRLGIGTTAHVLTVVGGVPAWQALPVDPGFANPMTAVGDLIRGGTSGAPTRLGVGANGTWLTLSGGVPTWASLPVDPGFANPMTAVGDLIRGGTSGAPTRLAVGTNGHVLTLTAGVPGWAAPASVGTVVVSLPLNAARLPDGTTNNAYPQPIERVSIGAQEQTWIPKPVTLVYAFDAVIWQHLIWKVAIPPGWAGGAVTTVLKWSAAAITGNIQILVYTAPLTDLSTDIRAVSFASAMGAGSGDVAVPATLGQQKESRIGPMPSTGYAAGKVLLVSVTLGPGTASSAAGLRYLEQAWLEFAP